MHNSFKKVRERKWEVGWWGGGKNPPKKKIEWKGYGKLVVLVMGGIHRPTYPLCSRGERRGKQAERGTQDFSVFGFLISSICERKKGKHRKTLWSILQK